MSHMRLEYPILFDYVKTFKVFNPSLEPIFAYMCGDTGPVEERLKELDKLFADQIERGY